MKKSAICVGLFLLSIAPLRADDKNVCPCFPMTHQWVVTACPTWTCAMSNMVLANGDPYVWAVPTGSDQWKWIVLKRVVAGSYISSPDEPFAVDQFEQIAEAGARYAALDHAALPMLLSTVDGKMLVVSLRPGMKRRATVP